MPRLLTALACLALAAPMASAQARYSPLITLGFGNVPKEYEHRDGSVAWSLALFKRLTPFAELGLEVGYQRFGSPTAVSTIGNCPVLPVRACVGQVTGSSHKRGHVWYVGPTLRLRTIQPRPLRPFALVGLAGYRSSERTSVTYGDDRGRTVPIPESFAYRSDFRGVGVNAGIGVEGGGWGRVRWTIAARAHSAIGGESGEMGSLRAYSLMLGMTLP